MLHLLIETTPHTFLSNPTVTSKRHLNLSASHACKVYLALNNAPAEAVIKFSGAVITRITVHVVQLATCICVLANIYASPDVRNRNFNTRGIQPTVRPLILLITFSNFTSKNSDS